MSVRPLGELVDVRGGGTPRRTNPAFYGGDIPWVTPKDMKRWLIGDSEVRLTDAGVDNSPARIIPAGSVLVVVRSGVLKHTLPVAFTTAPVTVNQDMKALVPGEEVCGPYLARFIKAMEPRILGWVRAKTADNFPVGSLLDLPVPLPSMEAQRRVAAILDHADRLRSQRQQSLSLIDEAEESLFADASDQLGTKRTTLAAAGVDFHAGRNLVAESSNEHPRNRVIKVSAVSRGDFDPNEAKPLPVDYAPPENHQIRVGDILFGRASGSLDLLGATVQVDEVPSNLFLPDKVWRAVIQPGAPINPEFLLGVLHSRDFKAFVRHNASGAAGVRNIGKSTVLRYSFALPSSAAQHDFALRARSVQALRKAQRRQRRELDGLFAALQQLAFAGQLSSSSRE